MALAFPSNPSVNQVYTYGYSSWRWDGESWNVYPSSMLNIQIVTAVNGITGNVKTIEVAATAPLTGNYEGKLWYNTNVGEGKIYVWYGGGWVGIQ